MLTYTEAQFIQQNHKQGEQRLKSTAQYYTPLDAPGPEQSPPLQTLSL